MTVKYYKNMVQNTDEWLQARLGIITASKIGTILTPTFKIAKNDKVKSYAYELAAQRISKQIEDNYQSWDMERGHIEEGVARDIYEENYAAVEQCGFITDDSLGFTLGFSPDGLVGDQGIIEIKSRQAKFQIQTIVSGEVPSEYMIQCQSGMMISGRSFCDFIQYSNGMEFFVKRVYKDPRLIETIKAAVTDFEAIVCNLVSEYESKAKGLIKTERKEYMNDDAIITPTGE